MLKKLLSLFLVLAISLTAVACTTANTETPQETPRTLSEVEIKQLAVEAVNVAGEAQTYQFDMDLSVGMKMTGGEMNLDTTMDGEMTGAVDYAAQKMMMQTTMTVDVPYEGKQQVPAEMYLVDGWVYTKAGAENWVKVQVSDALRMQVDAIRPQIELLSASLDVKYLGEETVDGVACYTMQVTPDMAALVNWLGQQNLAAGTQIDWDAPELANMFKEMSYRYWVSKTSKQLVKLNAHILLNISSDTLSTTPSSEDMFESIIMDMTMDMRLHDYGKPVDISLPAGAESATVVAS